MSAANAVRANPAYAVAAEALRGNVGQLAAYESKGNCVILAGPGSGKTKTLTIKMARMLAEDVRPPRGIACITYNNQCARELRRKLAKLGIENGKRAAIGTLHSFCLQHIVRPYARMAGLKVPEPLNVATTREQDNLFEAAVKEVIGLDEKVSDWSTRCERYRRTHLDRDEASWSEDDEQAMQVVEDYERRLVESSLVDFDAMVLLALQLVEGHKWVRTALRARFPVLVVDEYQDLGHGLHRIVLCLCFGAGMRLVAVGDPDQSIYGFTGAEPNLLRDLADRKDVERVQLQLNYRCGQTIIQASETALGEARGFKSGTKEMGTLDIHHRPDGAEDQAAYICDVIIPATLKRREGRRLGDIAVLYPTRYEGDLIADAVQKRGWDFIRIDQGNPYPRSPVIGWLEDCAAWCAGGWKSGEPRLSDLVRTWQHFNEAVVTDAGRRVLQRELVKFLHSHRTPDQPLRTWLSSFRELCLNVCLNGEPRLRDDVDAIAKLTNACAEGSKLASFTVSTFGGQRGAGTHLNLLTLYASKGMEFDVAILPFLEEGKLPSFRVKNDADLREQRRLFYVGLTRARHEVHLLYSGWYQTPWKKVVESGCSRFVTEVRKSIT